MAAHANGLIPKPGYSTSFRNRWGFRNHFQGMQRLPDRNYIVLSGSNTNAPMGNLFIIRLGSRREKGDWASNIMIGGKPSATDEMVKNIEIDSVMWHAGGLSVLGNILAVPIYGGKPLNGKLIFYDMSDPETPQMLPVEIQRPGRKAYAAAFTRLPNGYFLAAVLSDRDKQPRRIDFYLSRTTNFLEGFDSTAVSWVASEVQARNGMGKTFGDFQGISFIPQSDGRLYLVGFHNTIPSLRVIPGKDYADLYEVVFPDNALKSPTPRLFKPTLIKTAHRQFYCKDGFCNMDAGASLYIDPETRSLFVYAATFWLEGDIVKFTAYRSEANPADPPISDPEHDWIELYEKGNFRGKRLSILGTGEAEITDYANIYARGNRFNDRASSARFQIPAGWIYRLYSEKDYQGKYIDLSGTGRVESIANFKSLDFDDCVSSSRFIDER